MLEELLNEIRAKGCYFEIEPEFNKNYTTKGDKEKYWTEKYRIKLYSKETYLLEYFTGDSLLEIAKKIVGFMNKLENKLKKGE